MKFKINNQEWEIIELSQKEIKEKIKECDMVENIEDGRYFGSTQEFIRTIYIDKDLPIQQKRQTLIHELTHCYISTVLFSYEHLNMDIETLCDVASCSHDIIHEIVEWYFRERK